jgi:hypothetical protein
MTTIRQKKAAKLAVECITTGTPKTKGEILLEAGYSKEISERPSTVWTAEGFQKELSKLGDDRYLRQLDQIATDSEDKRACLEAIKMIFQLKGRFETKISVTAHEERDKVFERISASEPDKLDAPQEPAVNPEISG